jgi:CRP-like cAMP-binding protein
MPSEGDAMTAETHESIREALADQAQRPGALGPALWVLRMMQELGQEDEARAFAIQHLRSAGAPTHPGATLLMETALKAEVEHFLDGEQIFAEGDESHTLYCVLHGTVRLERLGVGVLARLPQGAAVGEVAALAKVHRTASAFAEGTVRVLSLSPKMLGILEAETGPLLDLLRRIYQHRVLSQLIAPDSPLAQLPAGDRRKLLAHLKPEFYEKGHGVIREGAPETDLHLILSGRARVRRLTVAEEPIPLADLGPGDHFGEVAFLEGVRAIAEVVALTPLTCFVLRREALRFFLMEHPEVEVSLRALAHARREDADRRAPPPPIVDCPVCATEQVLRDSCRVCDAPLSEGLLVPEDAAATGLIHLHRGE